MMFHKKDTQYGIIEDRGSKISLYHFKIKLRKTFVENESVQIAVVRLIETKIQFCLGGRPENCTTASQCFGVKTT